MPNSKHLAGLAAVVFCLLAESAVAGPDWSMIERARTAKQAEKTASASGTPVSSKRAYAYGPRAPYSPPYAAKLGGSMPAKAIMAESASH